MRFWTAWTLMMLSCCQVSEALKPRDGLTGRKFRDQGLYYTISLTFSDAFSGLRAPLGVQKDGYCGRRAKAAVPHCLISTVSASDLLLLSGGALLQGTGCHSARRISTQLEVGGGQRHIMYGIP